MHVHPKRFPLAYTADWQVCMLSRFAAALHITLPIDQAAKPFTCLKRLTLSADTGACHG